MGKKIRMVRDFPVAPNGYDTQTWPADAVYEDVDDQLADDLIGIGAAEAVRGPGRPRKADTDAAEPTLGDAADAEVPGSSGK